MSEKPQTQNVGDFIACVTGMGFSIEDAQEAVSAGKLSVEEAIEWILAGKPRTQQGSSSGNTLRLQQPSSGASSLPIGANPFSNPQPFSLSGQQGTGPPADGARDGGDDDEEAAVVSRTHLSEDQRRIKLQFEEKQRDEARRRARQEKAAEKKARAQVLKQIQDDRESQRLRRGAPAASATTGSTVAGSGSGRAEQLTSDMESPRAKEPRKQAEDKEKKCVLQIRLPDGRAFRESFPPDAILREVLCFVGTKMKLDNDMILMQPFPRKEFREAHMALSLTELGLTPSGSLVLKKQDTKRKGPPVSAEEEGSAAQANSLEAGVSRMLTDPAPPTSPPPEEESGAGALPPQPPPPIPPAPPFPGPSAAGHSWGAGQRLVADDDDQPMEEAAQQEEGGVDEAIEVDNDDSGDDDDDDENDDVGGAWGGGGWGGGGVPGPWGNPNWEEGHQWGEGQRLIGEVLDADNLPHHSKPAQELAAEAANQRSVRPHPMAGPSREEVVESAVPALPELPSLVQLTIRHLSARVCDTRQPITSFQGLPADVAMRILDHLIKERLLRPRTLQPFVTCCLRKLVLDCYPFTTNELLYALRRHTFLTYLSMVDSPLITDKGLAALRALKRLKYLSLSNCRLITDTCIPTLQEFPNLITLVLENTAISDVGIQLYCQRAPSSLLHLTLNRTEVTEAIFSSLAALPNLRSLNVECTQLRSLSGIEQLPRLEHLNISGTRMDPDTFGKLRSLPHLVALNVSLMLTPGGMPVDGDMVLQCIQDIPLQLLEMPTRHTTTDLGIQYISGMPLQTLDLSSYIHVTDAAAPYIRTQTRLTRLRLSHTKITDNGILQLKELKSLQELYLNGMAITDIGAGVVADFTHLRELTLTATGITNRFLQGGALHHCKLLSKLNLSRNRISNRGVSHLKLRSLTLLNLDGTKVKETIEAILKDNCPQLQKVILSNLQPITDSDEDM